MLTLPSADKAVESALNALVLYLRTSDDAWELLLHDLDATQRDAYRDHFRTTGNFPNVTLGFPRSQGKWPRWAVILLDDSLDTDFADFAAEFKDLEIGGDEIAAEVTGMTTRQNIAVVVATENADATWLHWLLVRRWLLARRRTLLSESLTNYYPVSATDLAPEQANLPESVWARQQTWAFIVQESAARALDESEYIEPPGYVGLEDVDFGVTTGKVTVEGADWP